VIDRFSAFERRYQMNDRVKNVLNSILQRFETGDIPEAIAYSMFPFLDVPSARWSLLNRTLMFLSATMDARGYKQWHNVNRYVKKGSKAFYIIVPYLKTIEDELDERKYTLKGFGVKAVFRVEDTDGEPLEYENIELPDVPLMERAEEWGISVRAIPGNYQYYGYFSVDRKEIAIATNQECVFFHELAHCADYLLNGRLKKGQDPLQEIIAELSAHALAIIVGKSAEDTVGNSYRYIQKYADQLNMSLHTACLKVMSQVEQVLNLILNGNGNGKQSFEKLVA